MNEATPRDQHAGRDHGSDPHAGHKRHEAGGGHGPPGVQDQHAGHDQHEGHSPEMFKAKFWLSFVLTLPVVFWSAHIQELLGYRAPA
ncbi:MAG TPA: hypothetical protein VMM12_18400, partial [Longimicrobiales bacterium]|nr:hypothetical protein [Longimicrobiales bacterium]